VPGKISFDLEALAADLSDSDAAVVERAIHRLRVHLHRLEEPDYRRAVEAICSLFYVDTADRPDLEEALDRAAALVAEQGAKVVPILIAQMQGSDLKSHLHLAVALGRIGRDALKPIRNLLATAEDPYSRSFALYALGKMACPEVIQAIPEVLGGLTHPDKEVRDSAARTLGKIVRLAAARRLTPRRRRDIFEGLLRAAGDPQPAVRAKAMRSLGKMAGAGLLNRPQKRTLAETARGALGEFEEGGWDHAFIVRKEAKETLERLLDDPPTAAKVAESPARRPKRAWPAPSRSLRPKPGREPLA
jgi:HEAT repeat protein